jgi:hypothetical protein
LCYFDHSATAKGHSVDFASIIPQLHLKGIPMNYRQSVRQFAVAFSKCAQDAVPTSTDSGPPQFSVASRGTKRFFLKASEDAFEEIPSNILITILTTKLRKDMRHAGFGSVALVSEA